MKTSIITLTLDRNITDTLQYHHKFVEILNVVQKSTQQYPIDHDQGCMRFTLTSGYQKYRVIIDINDLVRRVLDELVWGLSHTKYDHSKLNPFQEETLLGLLALARKLSLTNVHLYWFEWRYALPLSLIDEYQRLHRLERYSDTLHTCLFVLSVLSDCYKLKSEVERFEAIDYPAFQRSAVTNQLAESILNVAELPYDETESETFADSDYVFAWVSEYLATQHESYRNTLCQDFHFTLSYQQAYQLTSVEMAAYQVVMELTSVLCALPITYDLESTPIRR